MNRTLSKLQQAEVCKVSRSLLQFLELKKHVCFTWWSRSNFEVRDSLPDRHWCCHWIHPLWWRPAVMRRKILSHWVPGHWAGYWDSHRTGYMGCTRMLDNKGIEFFVVENKRFSKRKYTLDNKGIDFFVVVENKSFSKSTAHSTALWRDKEPEERQTACWMHQSHSTCVISLDCAVHDGWNAPLQTPLQALVESSFTFPLHKQIPRFTWCCKPQSPIATSPRVSVILQALYHWWCRAWFYSFFIPLCSSSLKSGPSVVNNGSQCTKHKLYWSHLYKSVANAEQIKGQVLILIKPDITHSIGV